MSEYVRVDLDDRECLRVLGSTSLGRVAFTVGTLPALAPVRFHLLGRHRIGFRTVTGSQLDTATRDGIVAFEAESSRPDDDWQSVTVIGRSKIVTDATEIDLLSGLPSLRDGFDEPSHFVLIRMDLIQGRQHRNLDGAHQKRRHSRRPGPPPAEEPTSSLDDQSPERGPLHEAFFYAGAPEFLRGVHERVSRALRAGGPILLVVPPESIDSLRMQLGSNAARVQFVNVKEVGRNPTRMIPLLLQFLSEHSDEHISIVTEPIWHGRPPAEYATAVQTEALFNLALEAQPANVVCACAYDVAALHAGAVEDAMRTHAVVVGHDRSKWNSLHYTDPATCALESLHPLPQPPAESQMLSIQTSSPAAIREFLANQATQVTQAGLAAGRLEELALAVTETVTDVLGVPSGLRVWHDPTSLVCELHSPRHLADPLTGRRAPTVGDEHAVRGLARANDICNLVQIDLPPSGTTIRFHLGLTGAHQ